MINAGIAGEYIVRKQKVLMENGAPKLDESGNQIPIGESWLETQFNNLITNQGLNFMGQSTQYDKSPVSKLTASTSTTVPAFTDNSILGGIGSVTLTNGQFLHEVNNTVKPYFVSYKKTFRFDAGIATGNITKLYVGSVDESVLWSVALVKDSLGELTVITKLPDEILDVTYILRTYVPSDDVLSTVTISGVTYNTITRIEGFNQNWGGLDGMPINAIIFSARASISNLVSIGTYVPNENEASVAQLTSYVQDSFEKAYRVMVDLNSGNSGIRTVSVAGNNCGYQIRFGSVASDAPIPKTADYKLILPPVTIKWGRYVPT